MCTLGRHDVHTLRCGHAIVRTLCLFMTCPFPVMVSVGSLVSFRRDLADMFRLHSLRGCAERSEIGKSTSITAKPGWASKA